MECYVFQKLLFQNLQNMIINKLTNQMEKKFLHLRNKNYMKEEIQTYNNKQDAVNKEICDLLATAINTELPEAESKIWHAHPVWFLNSNPIVGYSIQKQGTRLMFWSGADFDEESLNVKGKNFKDVSIFFSKVTDVELANLKRWLKKSRAIQWDYKNIVKRKGQLERLK
jgi:uncharacterized protein YdhG (YjbR/CyaY superfamily)